MKIRNLVNFLVGIAQETIGLLSSILAVLLFCDVLEVQALFNLPAHFVPIYLLVLVLFSLFSIVSGTFLIRDGRETT